MKLKVNNSQIVGNHCVIDGNGNNYIGNHGKINGNNNKFTGNHNCVNGKNNSGIGNHNSSNDKSNTASGNFNKGFKLNPNIEKKTYPGIGQGINIVNGKIVSGSGSFSLNGGQFVFKNNTIENCNIDSGGVSFFGNNLVIQDGEGEKEEDEEEEEIKREIERIEKKIQKKEKRKGGRRRRKTN